VDNICSECTAELLDINGRQIGFSEGMMIQGLAKYPAGSYRLIVRKSGVPILEKAVLKSE
jgi:hypothetical protein